MTVNDGITDVVERADPNQLRSSNMSYDYRARTTTCVYALNVYTLNPQCLAKPCARDHAAATVVPSAVVGSAVVPSAVVGSGDEAQDVLDSWIVDPGPPGGHMQLAHRSYFASLASWLLSSNDWRRCWHSRPCAALQPL
jgi:hypothetical protein